MWRLFKEVFKSLSKNKVVVIGLSILVFLTSAIFTLLSSVRNVIVGGFDNYKNVSKLHDVSVDLNLPTQGSAFNQGYFVNGESGETLATKGLKQYQPIVYYVDHGPYLQYEKIADEYLNDISYELNLNSEKDYLPFSVLGIDNTNSLYNYFFAKEDLSKLYSIYKAEKNSNIPHTVEFNLDDPNNAKFTIKDPSRNVRIYKKDGDKYSQLTISHIVKLSDTIKFDKELKLGELLSLKNIDNKLYATQISNIYVNSVTKEATIDYGKGIDWIDDNVGFRIKPNQIAKALNFTPSIVDGEVSSIIFEQKLSNFDYSQILINGATNKLDESLSLKTQIQLSAFIDNELTTNQLQLQPWPANIELKISGGWINKNETSTVFLRNHYYTSYVEHENGKSKWQGAFKTYIDSLGNPRKDKRNSEWDSLETFSYWKKQKRSKITGYKLDDNTHKWVLDEDKTLIRNFELPLSSSFNYTDLNTVKLWTNDSRISPLNQPYAIPIANSKTINDIEKRNLFGEAQREFNELDDKHKLDILNNENQINEKYTIINSKAYEATKKLIVDSIKEKVGAKNIGLRQTITVNGINDETGEQNVFHFINTGDQNYEITGIKLNVGGLFDESANKTALSNLGINSSTIYNSTQLNPYVSSMLIQSIFKNLYPDPNYIEPIYQFALVKDYNINTGVDRIYDNAKIVMLADYKNDNKDYSKQSTNYGILSIANKYKLVERTNNSGYFEVKYTNNMPTDGMDVGLLSKFLDKHKLTIATNFIRAEGDGWVKNDKEFENVYYIPIYYLAPKSQLMYDVLSNGKIDILAQTIEKYLLNSDLVKKQFLMSEQIIEIAKILKKVLNQHNFAAIFANGKMNQGIMAELGFDFIYELSHHEDGDLLKSLLFGVLQQVVKDIQSRGNIFEQRKYLISQVNNLFANIKTLTNFDLSQYITAEALVNSSKDPIKVVESFIKIVNSIDLKKMSELSREWFKTKNNQVIKGSDNIYYTTKLSSGTIIKWVFSSINQKYLKEGLTDLIDNLDLTKALNLDNPNSLLFVLLSNLAPDLVVPLKPIINKMDSRQGNEAFDNVKVGLINIIKGVDFNILNQELLKSIKTKFVKYTEDVFNLETGKNETKQYNVVLDAISPKDGIMSFLKSMFSLQGSNRTFKDNLIKMFNLSAKTKTIKILDKTIFLPDADDDKISFFDFLGIFTSLLQGKENVIFRNYTFEVQLYSLKEVLSKAHPDEKVNLSDFNIKEIQFVNKFNVFDKNYTNKDALDKVNKLILFINQTKGGTNIFTPVNSKTGADLLFDLLKFQDGNTTWQLVKSAIDSSATTQIDNEYALGAQTFDVFTPYLQMFKNNDANFEEANKFVKDFLNFSINPEVLKLSQAKSTDDNIPFEENLNWYITEYLQNPESIDLFNQNSSGEFINENVRDLVNHNPQYKKWIANNKQLLIRELGFIGASKKFSSNDNEQKNGIYHYTISKFVENYLSKHEFFDYKDTIIALATAIGPNVPVQVFGISKALVNPVLRAVFPEISITYLAAQKIQPGLINGNLQYLVLNKINNLELLVENNSDAYNDLSNLFDATFVDNDTSLVPINLDKNKNLVMDGPRINDLKVKSQSTPSLFGLNIVQMIPEIISDIVEPKAIKEIVFNSSSSFVAKANFAYLSKNNKEIFDGDIPSDPLEINKFINNLDKKYILDVNGIKFVIVGQETTVDYMYPIVDENNLQVNTKNQALVYVNKWGFSRIKLAYAGNVIKQALLVKNNGQVSNEELKSDITEVVNKSISDSNKLQRVFYTNEIDPINPERALRLNTVESVIKLISISTLAIMSALMVVVGVSIIFIIKRYISNKNKVLGILVAQGYTATQIGLSLTVFALVTSIIGGVLGYVVGNRLQLLLLNVFSSYWTLPKETVKFDWITMIITVFVPFIGMSLLIYIVSLISLRFKPNELITGVINLPKTKVIQQYYKATKKANVKGRFSFVLALGNFWKLIAFSVSVMLTSSATLFGIASNNVFTKTIDNTYQNRNYKFKIDMETPTIEGGPYKLYNANDLYKNIYTPIGESIESQREIHDYFRPGYSSVINKNGKNGIPSINDSQYDSHILTQFSAAIKVDAGVSADPWLVAYNSMPDSQKAKIDKLRDRVGITLEKTQAQSGLKWVIDKKTQNVSLVNKNDEKVSFFKYYHSPYDKQGNFTYAEWDGKEYQMKTITTEPGLRSSYRNFLVNGYKVIEQRIKLESQNPDLIIQHPKNFEENYSKYDYWLNDAGPIYGPTVNDYFISFGGVYFNPDHDEVYTYIKSNYDGRDIKIYGYQNNSKYVKLVNDKGVNLYEILYKFNEENVYPLIINEVVARQNNLRVGSQIKLDIQNSVSRFKEKILSKIENKTISNQSATFKVVAINPTYINSEFITRYDVANKLIGFDDLKLPDNFVKFNGVLTNNDTPLQVTNSTGLYSVSGYWSGIDSFDVSTMAPETMKAMFDQIFHPENGVLAKTLTPDQIMKFLDPAKDKFDQSIYNNIREQPKEAINNFAQTYNNKIYVALSSAIDSKDIEAGFTSQIGNTIQTLTVVIISLSFIISLVILIIMSTIMISENQKNIAIWSILGYDQKEKIKMYFSVYVPFILFAILLSIPIVMFVMYTFNLFLLSVSSIALTLTLNPIHVLITTALIFIIFIVTSLITWITVNKMKPVDLLKGK
ncbi:ABC transporter permease [Mycoplasma sp. ES3225-GEN-MYC]|uniref:ABC transporter permease n=1 Tax=Mycoplasma miroungigenitalium TaxID=754515 RepID=UPI001C0F4B0D|nr:FtsX-like permease family protein [Mycoplasma miroungigenitalium]MBU4691736.1 ABC transporter permease [Mycoplasma miroungigenitalium]